MTLSRPVLALLPPLLWFGYFLAIYGVNALACASGWPPRAAVAAHAALTLAALLVQAWPLWRLWRLSGDGFYREVGLGLGGLSLLATLWVGAMAWMVPPCG